MTKQEIESKYPMEKLFSALLKFASERPIDDFCPLTRKEINTRILNVRKVALSDSRYDLFTRIALDVKRNMVEGNFCEFAPLLCGWGPFYIDVVSPLYGYGDTDIQQVSPHKKTNSGKQWDA